MRYPQWMKGFFFLGLALVIQGGTDGPAQEDVLILADFEADEDLAAWSSEAGVPLTRSEEQVAEGQSALRMVLPAGPYPGVYCADVPRDWSGYGGLVFEIHVPRDVTLGLRVDDVHSTGYETRYNNDQIPLRAGWNTIFTPLRKVGQKIDLTQVRAVVIFLLNVEQETTVYLDHVRLVRQGDRLLNGFETEEDRAQAEVEAQIPLSLSQEQVTQGQQALKAVLPPGPYPGLLLRVPPDWRAYEALKFDLWCERNSFLGIRIDDANSVDYNTRYNQDGSVARQGWNRVQVPLDEVAQSIDVGRVTKLVIFLLDVAEPTTIYLDNVRLGAFDAALDDRPVPGELGAKKEFAWSMEVETPHVDWADPYANGPIKALLVPGIFAGREAIELRQRLSLDADIVTVEKTWDINRWGMGDFYGARGDRGDFRLQYRYLEWALTGRTAPGVQATEPQSPVTSHQSPATSYDVIVLPLVHGWNALTPRSREALKEQVRQGTGLVLIHPYVGPDGEDRSIWELSPLIGCADDFMPEDGYVRIPPGALVDGHPKWEPVGEHFITRGVPLGLLPFNNMGLYRYEPNGEVILRAGEQPVAAVKEFGKGRVVAFGYRNADLLPNLEGEDYPAWDYWEYLYSLMIRAILWAGRKEADAAIQGLRIQEGTLVASIQAAQAMETRLVVRLTNEHRGFLREKEQPITLRAGENEVKLPLGDGPDAGRLIVDARLHSEDGVWDWGTCWLDVPSPVHLTDIQIATNPIPQGDPLTGQARWEREGEAKGNLLVELVDEEDRVIAQQVAPLDSQASTLDFSLPTDLALTFQARVRASVVDGNRLLDRRESRPVVITPRDRYPDGLNFHAFMAGVNYGNFPYLRSVYRQRLREMGAEAGTTFGDLPNSLGVSGMGVYAYDAAPYRERKRLYQETKDKQYLIRQPCLNSPEWRQQTRESILARAPAAKAYHPFSYYVNDEGSLTSYTDSFDLCFGPHCLAKFREWLRTIYPSLEALNATWQTHFATWDDVMPMTTEEIQARTLDTHTPTHPHTHTPSYAPWADHRTFMELTYADAYRFIRDCLREVDPEGELRISGTQATVAYNGCDWSRITEFVKDTGPYTTGDQWELHRSFFPDVRSGGWTGYGSSGDGVRHFIWDGLFHRLSYMNIFWQYACLNPDLTFSRSAQDMAVAFKELRDGIGMLLNHARREPTTVAIHYSLPSCHLATITGHFADWDQARHNWILLLNDLGYQFDFVAAQQVEAGVLAERGFQVFVLPYSVALSEREIKAVQDFLKAGGTVLVSGPCGVYDEHGLGRAEAALDSWLASPLPAPPAQRREDMGVHPSQGEEERGVRVVNLTHPVRVNQPEWSVANYASERLEASGQSVRQALGSLLRDRLGVRPPVSVRGADGQEFTCCPRTYFRDGDVTYVCLLRDNLAGRTVVGPDGVAYTQDTGAAAAPEPITLAWEQPRHVYDVRAGEYLGLANRVETTIASAEAKIFALLPQRVDTVSVSRPREKPRPGEPLTLSAAVVTENGDPSPTRVLHFDVLTPDGQVHPLYSQNVLTVEGVGTLTIPLAFNDPSGEWQVRVRDVASGCRAEVSWTLP